MTNSGDFRGRRVLIVEDDYFLAEFIAKGLAAAGAEVVGPVGDVDDALDLIDAMEHLDGAVLDLNLHGEMAFPVADALMERNVHLVFATGYDRAMIPARFASIRRCEKPVNLSRIGEALFG
jgi:DNA-binding LytR/AlgR family response regulator